MLIQTSDWDDAQDDASRVFCPKTYSGNIVSKAHVDILQKVRFKIWNLKNDFPSYKIYQFYTKYLNLVSKMILK